jgi:ADP-ribose pyrophosphatase YjhB (NUDIX family)
MKWAVAKALTSLAATFIAVPPATLQQFPESSSSSSARAVKRRWTSVSESERTPHATASDPFHEYHCYEISRPLYRSEDIAPPQSRIIMSQDAKFASILKGWGPTLTRAIRKANYSRWPSGAPGGKGGQFAPGKGGGGSSAPWSGSLMGFKAPQFGLAKPLMAGPKKWVEPGDKPPEPKPAPPGAKPHLKTDDYGKPVTINYPTKASGKETWHDPNATATFIPGGEAPEKLNGVPLKPWVGAPTTINGWANVEGQRPELDQDVPFTPAPGKSVGAGVIVVEADGRIWLTKPTNHFGGYQQTFPKGTVEQGLSLQASAIKEAYEETGLKVRITGVLGDYERTTSVARFYVAQRVGGTPADMGWESQALRLAARQDLKKLLNMGVDKDILDDYLHENLLKRAPLSLIRDRAVIEEAEQRRGLAWLLKAGAPPKGGAWQHQERWPAGTPLGGQWKAMGADGLTLPPKVAGGLEGKNASYQKQLNALHASAQGGDLKTVLDAAITLDKKVKEHSAAGKKSSHVKWTAQNSQYATQLVADLTAKPKAEAAVAKLEGPEKLSSLTFQASKKTVGGSNPGGIYTDAEGNKWLVKGNLKLTEGAVTKEVSDNRAKNEVLAAKLIAAAGFAAPDMKLVDLEGQYGGGLGVAVKWVDGVSSFKPNSPGHQFLAQEQYAVHAWLGNYDVLGMGFDNTVIKDGQAINIDPGGAILFRAQGLPKDSFGKDAKEWESMRSTTGEQKAIFGKMTASQLQDSAKSLAAISDDTIKKLVDAHGPGDAKAKADLADTLIARRDAILKKAGVVTAPTPVAEVKTAEPAPPPAPPKLDDVVKAPADTPIPTAVAAGKPAFNSGMNSDAYYAGLVDQAEALHKAGDLAGLQAMIDPKKAGTWGNKTVNSKKLVGYHDALTADLVAKKAVEVKAVETGAKAVVDDKGTTWKAENGVLNPVGATPAPTPEYAEHYGDAHSVMLSVKGKGPASDMLIDKVAHAYAAKDMKAMFAAKSLIDQNAEVEAISVALANSIKSKADFLGKQMLIETGKAKNMMEAAALINVADAQIKASGSTSLFDAAPAPAPAPAAPKPTPAVEPKLLSMKEIDSAMLDAFDSAMVTPSHFLASSKESDKPMADMIIAAAGGNLEGVQSIKVASDNEKKFQAALVAAMTAPAATPDRTPKAAAPAPEPVKASVALPDFAKVKIDPSNSNASSHNGKVDQIEKLAKAGDVKGLLALNFGVNTYGKKQAALANDALAALGSVHTVVPGQKANAHWALVNGTAQNPPPPKVEPIPTSAPPAAAGTAPKPVYKIPRAPDFENWHSAGKGLSSVAAVNTANTKLVNQMKELGDKLDAKALEDLKFAQLDKATGQETGKILPIAEHPSQHIKAYHADVLYSVKNPYVPEQAMTAEQLASIPDTVKQIAKMHGDVTALKEAKDKAGRYAILGKVDGKPFDGFPPKTVSQKQGNAPINDLYQKSMAAFKALSKVEQQAIKDYTGGSYASMNASIVNDNPNDKAGKAIKGMKKASVLLPEGLTLSRKFTFPNSSDLKKLVEAQGSVIKEFGIISTSTNPSTWGGDVHVKITAAPGAKGLYVAYGGGGGSAISNHPSENEIILPFGSRFYVKKVTQGPKAKHTDATGAWAQHSSTLVELVLLPDLD